TICPFAASADQFGGELGFGRLVEILDPQSLTDFASTVKGASRTCCRNFTLSPREKQRLLCQDFVRSDVPSGRCVLASGGRRAIASAAAPNCFATNYLLRAHDLISHTHQIFRPNSLSCRIKRFRK